MMSLRDSFEWMFRNRQSGGITIGQQPNLAFRIFAVTTAVGVLMPRGRVRTAAAELAVGVLAWWAGDEIVRGVNPYRRIGGAAVLGWVVLSGMRRPRGRPDRFAPRLGSTTRRGRRSVRARRR